MEEQETAGIMENRNKEFDKCGPFQIYHTTLTQFTRFATAWTLSLMMFGNYNPGWKCLVEPLPPNTSAAASSIEERFQNMNLINKTNLTSMKPKLSSGFYNTNLISNQSVEVSRSSCDYFAICDTIEFNPSSTTIVSDFGLICDQSFAPSIIISIQMTGMFVGAIMSGQLGEWFGRKIVLYCSTALCSVSTLLAIFSPSWQVYAVFFFFIGAGSGSIMVICGVYSMEFLQPKWRARMIGVPFYSFSLALFAVVLFLLKNWIYIHIATAVLCAVACVGYFWSPESLRWLLVHGRIERSKFVIEKINKVNKKHMEMSDVTDYLCTLDKDEDTKRKYTNLDLFRSSEMRWITLRTSVLWLFTIMGYYALAYGVKSLVGDFYINALISGIVEIPAVLSVAPVMNILGRRIGVAMYITIGALGYLTAVCIYYVGTDEVSHTVSRYAAFLAKAAAVACVNSINLLSTELFPTAVRNIGVAFLSTVGRAGAIMAPYLLPRDQDSLILCYLVLGIASVFNVIVVLSLPETKDKALRDSLSSKVATDTVVDELEDPT